MRLQFISFISFYFICQVSFLDFQFGFFFCSVTLFLVIEFFDMATELVIVEKKRVLFIEICNPQQV